MKRPAQFALTTVIIGTTAALLIGAEDPAAMAAPSPAVAQCQERVAYWESNNATLKAPRNWRITCVTSMPGEWAGKAWGLAYWYEKEILILAGDPAANLNLENTIAHESAHAWQERLTSKQLGQLSRETKLPVFSSDGIDSALEVHAAKVAECNGSPSAYTLSYKLDRLTCKRANAWLTVAQRNR